MNKKVETPAAAQTQGEVLPVVEPQRGACVDFVEFCKEQYLIARAAQTFLRVLHNPNWEAECARIRESMRPEVQNIFDPIEKNLASGANCREILAQLTKALAEAEK